MGAFAALFLLARPSRALDAPVAVEIGEGAETLIDARAARRLIALELADVNLPRLDSSKRQRPALFFRVVEVGQDLRVELWERGEFLGARTVSGTRAAGQLGARRVALAAAELARRLQRKRQMQADHERIEEARRKAAREREARRTLDGPLALRPSFEAASIGRASALLFGPRLLAEYNVAPRARIDGGLAWLGGSAPDDSKVEWLELSLAPSARLPLSEALDLDLALDLGAALVRFERVRGVDAISDQHETWSARAAAVVRIEPRLTRNLRLSIGASGGLVLRETPFESLAGGADRLRGAWLSLDLGVVFTPD
ncbi:MAG TPA: hypothetical protein VHV51_05305 [Polyangiaceae bacterium]|nr:hypothetical protein [Polyangiaceae bacterium]